MRTRVVGTCFGPVEVSLTAGDGKPVVLCFPGGHTTAATPLGADVYTEMGYRVLTFSRPGYGRTNVGDLTAAEFVPAVRQVCGLLGIVEVAATVGVSFGGLQAIEVAALLPHLAPRLVLHSCAPSTLPYPETAIERLAAPIVFGRAQSLTWHVVRTIVSSDWGLRLMMARLSTLPTVQWWDSWTSADRAAARATFSKMESGSGFLTDVRQGSADRASYREALLRSVQCPTLVTASRNDGGVSFTHAEDLVRTIRHARLVQTSAANHFYWLGTTRQSISDSVRTFLAE